MNRFLIKCFVLTLIFSLCLSLGTYFFSKKQQKPDSNPYDSLVWLIDNYQGTGNRQQTTVGRDWLHQSKEEGGRWQEADGRKQQTVGNDYNRSDDVNNNLKQNIQKELEEQQKKELARQKAEAKSIINDIVATVIQQQHGVWDNFKYDNDTSNKLCKVYPDICDKIIFNWTFSQSEKITYQGLIIYAMSNIDSFLTTKAKLSQTLYTISLNKTQSWRRGYAGHHTLTINLASIKSYTEFFEVVTHEFWHNVDLGVIEGNSSYLDKNFTEFNQAAFSIDDKSLDFYKFNFQSETSRLDRSSFKDFVSWYALTNPFEDFAETFNMYLNHHDFFKELAETNYILAQKYDYMSYLLWGKYFFNDSLSTKKLQRDPLFRPWDSTRIRM